MEGTVIILLAIYIIIFLTSVIGNSSMMASVLKNDKLQTSVFILLANVSLSDFIFTILSLADCAYFVLNLNWVFQEAFCKIQGAFIEVTYTVSMLTLAVIAAERYAAICRLLVEKRSKLVAVKRSAKVWLLGIAICSPLFYGYKTTVLVPYDAKSNMSLPEEYGYYDTSYITDQPNATSKVRCTINGWSPRSGVIFYSVHTFLVYLVPLIVMIVCHSKITIALKKKEKTSIIYHNPSRVGGVASTSGSGSDTSHQVARVEKKKNVSKERLRNIKVIKLLVAVTTTFFCIWTPYIIVRLLWHFSYDMPMLVWKVIQVIVFCSAAVNFFIYLKMSPELRKTVLSFCLCKQLVSLRRGRSELSRSSRNVVEMTSGQGNSVEMTISNE